MKKNYLISGIIVLITFVVFTILLFFADRQTVAATGTQVGFYTMNTAFQNAITSAISEDARMSLYKGTDWGSIPAVVSGLVFAVVGLVQWIKRKKLLKVDRNILILGLFYILLFILFLLFTYVIKINYRPVLIDGKLESSYPSSTTLLSIGCMLAAIVNNNIYVKNKKALYTLNAIEILYMIFLIVGRLLAGVHWLTDIIASLILGAGLFLVYLAIYKETNISKEEVKE